MRKLLTIFAVLIAFVLAISSTGLRLGLAAKTQALNTEAETTFVLLAEEEAASTVFGPVEGGASPFCAEVVGGGAPNCSSRMS